MTVPHYHPTLQGRRSSSQDLTIGLDACVGDFAPMDNPKALVTTSPFLDTYPALVSEGIFVSEQACKQ
jgi:hypothetical protein